MARRILSVIAGLLVAMVVITGVEAVIPLLYPVPPGLDMKDPAAFKVYVAALPIGALLMVILAHSLGALVGAVVATLIAGRASIWPGMIVGALVMVAGIVNLFQISHPVWFSVVDLLLYLPAAYGGARLMLKRPAAAPGG